MGAGESVAAGAHQIQDSLNALRPGGNRGGAGGGGGGGKKAISRLTALERLLALSANSITNSKAMFAGDDNHFLQDMLTIVGPGKDMAEEQLKALDLLNNVAVYSDIADMMGRETLGMVDALATLAKSSSNMQFGSTSTKVLVKSVSILKSLAVNDDTHTRMIGSDRLGLVDVLIRTAKDDAIDKEGRILSLSILSKQNSKLGSDIKVRLISAWPGVLEFLVKTIKSEKSVNCMNALQIVWNLSGNASSPPPLTQPHSDFISKMGSTNVGLIDLLLSIINSKLKSISISIGIGISSSNIDDTASLAFKTLWYMSRIKDNRIRMGSPKLELVDLLISVVQQVPTSRHRLSALNILQNLATNSGTLGPNKMAGEKIQFLESLVSMLRDSDSASSDNETFSACMGIVKNLSHNIECQRRMGSSTLPLLELLVEIISKTKSFAHKEFSNFTPEYLVKRSVTTMSVLFNLSLNKFNEIRMASVKLGFVEILIEIICNKRSNLRVSALGVVWNLAAHPENQKSFGGNPSKNVIDLLVDIAILEDDTDAGLKALAALKNFSQAQDNQAHMCTSRFADFLTMKLKSVYASGNLEAPYVSLSLGIITNLSTIGVNKKRIGMKEDGSVEVFVKILSNENLSVVNQIMVLNVLWNLSLSVDVKTRLSANTLGLVDTIIEMFVDNKLKSNRNPKDKQLFFEANGKALSVLWNISEASMNIVLIELHQNYSLIGNDKVGFLKLLIRFFAADKGEARIIALKTLFNLCRSKEMKAKMSDPALGLKAVVESFSKEEEYLQEKELRNTALDILFSLNHETSRTDIGDHDLLDNYHDEVIKKTELNTVAISTVAAIDSEHKMSEMKEDFVENPDLIHDSVEGFIDQEEDNDLFDSYQPAIQKMSVAFNYEEHDDMDHLGEHHQQHEHQLFRKPSTATVQEGGNYSINDFKQSTGYSVSNFILSDVEDDNIGSAVLASSSANNDNNNDDNNNNNNGDDMDINNDRIPVHDDDDGSIH